MFQISFICLVVTITVATNTAINLEKNHTAPASKNKNMFRTFTVAIFITIIISTSDQRIPFPYTDIKVVTRKEWGARKAKDIQMLLLPVPYVIIHHTGLVNPACTVTTQCMKNMRDLQAMNMDGLNMDDIAYNFVVAGDQKVYEGTGWYYLGSHSQDYSMRSIGIALLGDWASTVPPQEQMMLTQKFIKEGVHRGFISKNYKLKGHIHRTSYKYHINKYFEDTQCPGLALYKNLRTWEHFDGNV